MHLLTEEPAKGYVANALIIWKYLKEYKVGSDGFEPPKA